MKHAAASSGEVMEKTDKVLSEQFKPVGEVAVDERNRVPLTKALEALKGVFPTTQDLRFSVSVNEVGQLLLSPVISVPLHEAWLYKNSAALKKVIRGLSQGNRELNDPGSFDQYADEEIE
jgi:hypothetical protein